MDLPARTAHEAIREVPARYTLLGDSGDSAGVSALFTDDGVLDVGPHGGVWHGRDRIRSELGAVADRIAATAGGSPGPVRHHVSSLLVDALSPNEAVAASYFAV